MLDTSDELHEVPVHGTYFNKAWASGNGVSKVTNGDMRIVRQYVRASRLFIPRDGAKHMPDHLPVEIPGENLQSMWVFRGSPSSMCLCRTRPRSTRSHSRTTRKDSTRELSLPTSWRGSTQYSMKVALCSEKFPGFNDL
ncbi:hypothetical protein FVEG_15557 [Fusarium verticillioides 7600]|uniref:Uncharacterized protein n=1 Tax=Gibberella moniliformis (strain M3125 / FGSC 7600) TaxID=334819 RepID=W7MEX9_GIBM7|nr:hypothetical protein FVEG_15557 [Fusarium verticillioides 7600]EWG43317.1 hypothetical protein FVEG_15557 [Fusarium verticillioides 7600]